MNRQGSLALATSMIHRSRSVEDLRRAFFLFAPRFVHGHAYGMYLFDEKLNTESIFYYRANQKFLNEYEKIRNSDPLFKWLLQEKKFTHSLEIFDMEEWLDQPLHHFLSQWGLDYSIEAPLIVDGQVKGTLNIARTGSKYFDPESLTSAGFLCGEIDAAFKRIHELESLKSQLARNRAEPEITVYLSVREQEVLQLAITGLGNRAIASRLEISENTVRHHLKRIYLAYCVHNRAQLVQRVLSRGSPARMN